MGMMALTIMAGCTAPEHEPLTEATVTEKQAIHFYIAKLPDRDYVKSYGDMDNPRPWYTAAEALGAMGKPAIPALITRLDTPDPYELKLVLYALMLATQDPTLQSRTGGDYVQLPTVLNEDSNDENRQRARDWWERHRHLWGSDAN